MFDALRHCDEWLVFTWDGRRFGVPNARGHLIEMVGALRPDPSGIAAASYIYRGKPRPVHRLDGELRLALVGVQPGKALDKGDRHFFVFFGGLPEPFGLLCEQADVLQAREQGLRLHELPPALRPPGSPLIGAALGAGEEEPILLTAAEALQAFLTQADAAIRPAAPAGTP